uniref:Uncharacterized protein n=1 Tax=Rhizophora mucronata TaxID=61149 RepID=A0A2P2J0J0_RHIMU
MYAPFSLISMLESNLSYLINTKLIICWAYLEQHTPWIVTQMG